MGLIWVTDSDVAPKTKDLERSVLEASEVVPACNLVVFAVVEHDVADLKGTEVDRRRDLTKSVTAG